MVLGVLLRDLERPAWFLPLSGRLYLRKSQLPDQPGFAEQTAVFRTQCEMAVELTREQAKVTEARHLALLDGGFALATVIQTLVTQELGRPRIEILTRLLHDALLYSLPSLQRRP